MSVNLDHQSGLYTAEIHDERPDGLLSTKMRPVELSPAQSSPEPLLRGCQRLPQVSGLFLRGGSRAPPATFSKIHIFTIYTLLGSGAGQSLWSSPSMVPPLRRGGLGFPRKRD